MWTLILIYLSYAMSQPLHFFVYMAVSLCLNWITNELLKRKWRTFDAHFRLGYLKVKYPLQHLGKGAAWLEQLKI